MKWYFLFSRFWFKWTSGCCFQEFSKSIQKWKWLWQTKQVRSQETHAAKKRKLFRPLFSLVSPFPASIPFITASQCNVLFQSSTPDIETCNNVMDHDCVYAIPSRQQSFTNNHNWQRDMNNTRFFLNFQSSRQQQPLKVKRFNSHNPFPFDRTVNTCKPQTHKLQSEQSWWQLLSLKHRENLSTLKETSNRFRQLNHTFPLKCSLNYLTEKPLFSSIVNDTCPHLCPDCLRILQTSPHWLLRPSQL